MQEKSGSSRRFRNDDPYRVGIHHETGPTPKQEFPTLKQQISRDLKRAVWGAMLTMALWFAAAVLGIAGTTGSYWGDWKLCWQSYLPFHLGALSAVFTLWSFIRALLTALILK